MRSFLIFIISLSFYGCAVSKPLSGPGYDSQKNKIKGDPHRKVIIAITNASVNRSKRGSFDSRTQDLHANLKNFQGFIAGSIRLKLLGKEVWTYSIWENEEALKQFVKSRDHVDAMYMTDSAIEKMRNLHLSVMAKDAPLKWSEIEKIINQKEMTNYKPL